MIMKQTDLPYRADQRLEIAERGCGMDISVVY